MFNFYKNVAGKYCVGYSKEEYSIHFHFLIKKEYRIWGYGEEIEYDCQAYKRFGLGRIALITWIV